MPNQELIFPGAAEFGQKALSIVDTANGIMIRDDDGLQEVSEFLGGIKSQRKELDRLCDPAIDAAFKEHRARVGLKKEFSAPLDQAEAIAKKKMSDYDERRRAERAAEQKRLDDIARAEAEEKRKIEMARIEAENKIRREKEAEEKKKRDAEIARLKKEGDAKAAKEAQERAKREALAAEQRAADDKARAAVLAAKPLEIETKVVIETAPKLAGATISRIWTGEIIGGPNQGDLDPTEKEKNLRLLIEAIARKEAPIYLVQENATEIRKMGESTKGTVQVPGVRFYDKPRVASR